MSAAREMIVVNPRGHRAAWVEANPQAMVANGGLLSPADLERYACDLCMAALDPDQPHPVLDGMSLCPRCALRHPTHLWPECQCASCARRN